MKKIKTLVIWMIIFSIIIFAVNRLEAKKIETATYTEVLSSIKAEKVKEVKIDSEAKKISYKEDGKTKNANIPSMESFMEENKERISSGKLNIIQEDVKLGQIIKESMQIILPTIIGVGIILFVLSLSASRTRAQMGMQAAEATKSKARLIEGDENETTFADVAGIDEEKEELKEIVDFLKNPSKYTEMGARIPKGVLLVGRPGTGKTLLAKAVAGEVGVPFFTISGSDFVEMYSGVGAKRVREMFIDAKRKSPCVIFIDEIDAVGRQRGAGLGAGNDEREQTLNQLLVEMDGFKSNEGVIVLAATNRADILDTALLRAGRFDRQIMVSMPDAKARKQILEVHSKNKKLAKDVSLDIIARNTPGFAGADLENVLNEAALLAARKEIEYITENEIEEAMKKVSMGPEKKSKVISEKERKLVSYHEGGHAVVSYFLPSQEKVHEISIVPRGMAGGYTMYRQSEDKSFMSKKEMEENIIGLLGGRLAEELILGDISTGASNDIQRATKIARDMVTKYGMSAELGTIYLSSSAEHVFLGRDIAQQRNISEETAAKIDKEVKQIIDSAYRIGKEILASNMDKLHQVAAILMENEKITGEEFKNIMKD